ncbi:MAG: septum site-determining protein MinC [Caldisericia bacterium]|nr:septum site-determining protein MinC [Caldisericia bacterium]MDD4614444.1 septum site-determining protein MinC [Caldisericia bacterium]
MPAKRTPDSVVSFKGFSEGILMSLMLHDFEFDKVIRKAVSIYKKKQDFFGANVDLYATGFDRELTDDEGGMVRKMFAYLIQKPVHTYRDNTPNSLQTSSLTQPTDTSFSSLNASSDNPEKVSSFSDPNEFLVIGKNVRAGVVVQSPGNIIVFGDIHSGAKVIAGKSLYVFGSIKGEAGFGQHPECKQAILACKEIKAMRIIAANQSLDNTITTLGETSIPVYIYLNEGDVSIVKITHD